MVLRPLTDAEKDQFESTITWLEGNLKKIEKDASKGMGVHRNQMTATIAAIRDKIANGVEESSAASGAQSDSSSPSSTPGSDHSIKIEINIGGGLGEGGTSHRVRVGGKDLSGGAADAKPIAPPIIVDPAKKTELVNAYTDFLQKIEEVSVIRGVESTAENRSHEVQTKLRESETLQNTFTTIAKAAGVPDAEISKIRTFIGATYTIFAGYNDGSSSADDVQKAFKIRMKDLVGILETFGTQIGAS